MEGSVPLLCYMCGNIYDQNDKLPMTGSCSHSICSLCFAHLTDLICPICKQENSFQNPLENSEILENLQLLHDELAENNGESIQNSVKKMKQRNCFKCNESREAIRICVNCAEEKGILMKEISRKKWIVQGFSQNLFSNSSFWCNDCVFEHNDTHTTVSLENVTNLLDVVKYEFFLELLEKEETIVDDYLTHLKQYYNEINTLQGLLLEAVDGLTDDFRDIAQYTRDSYDDIVSKLRNSIEQRMKLKRRELIYHQKQLEIHIESIKRIADEDEEEESDQEDEAIIIQKLIGIHNKFIQISTSEDFQLTEDDIKLIDEDVDQKMEKLEENYKKNLFMEIRLADDSKFYKYQSLLKEYENVMETMKFSNEVYTNKDKMNRDVLTKLEEKINEIDKTVEFLKERRAFFEEQHFENQMDQLMKLRLMINMDRMEESVQLIKNLMELNENQRRLNYFNLLHLKFFSPNDLCYESTTYTIFINYFKDMNFGGSHKANRLLNVNLKFE